MGLLFAWEMKGAESILGRKGLKFKMVFTYCRNREEQDGFLAGDVHTYKAKKKKINC